jgi:hypothetical protein
MCALLLASRPGLVRAQGSPSAEDLLSARAAFDEGMDLRDKGEVAAALPKLDAAYAYAETPITGLELGRTYMMLGRLVDAYETLKAVQRMPQAFDESERSAAARRQVPGLLAQIEPRIASLKITLALQPGQSGTVLVDGKSVALVGFVVLRRLDPGKHAIAARAGDGPEVRQTVELGEGESKEIELAPEWVEPKQPRNVTEIKSTNPLVYIGLGTASLFLGTSISLFILANSKADNVLRGCGTDYCPQRLTNDDKAAHGLAFVGGFFFLSSLAAAGVMVFGMTHPTKTLVPNAPPPQAKVAPVIGLGGVGVRGSF